MTYRVGKTPTEVNNQVNQWMLKGQPSLGRMSRNILTHDKTSYTEDFFVNDTAVAFVERIKAGNRTAHETLICAIKQEPVDPFSPLSKL